MKKKSQKRTAYANKRKKEKVGISLYPTLNQIRSSIIRLFRKLFPDSEHIIDTSEQKEILFRFSIVFTGILVFAILIIVKMIMIMTIETPKYRLSVDIKDDLESAVYLNCNYEDLKTIYDRKPRIDIRSKSFFNHNQYYETSVDLSLILDDMIFDYYMEKKNDSLYIKKLKEFKIQDKERNPFDRLEEAQKELFISLRNNSGEHYPLIEDNILKISNELSRKNEAIDTYLDKSNQSYILSIIALLFSVLTPALPYIRRKIQQIILKKGIIKGK